MTHSAVVAGIFKGLSSVSLHLMAFDTAVVDLSKAIDHPAGLLMRVELGGGTDIAGAVAEVVAMTPEHLVEWLAKMLA